MTQVEKQLLLKDICARLPYGVKVKHYNTRIPKEIFNIDSNGIITVIRKIEANGCDFAFKPCEIEKVKPYLRPMSSMTEEEMSSLSEYTNCNIAFNREDIKNSICLLDGATLIDNVKASDWLNSHHFDYRGLIKKGLALEAPEGMYKNN